MWPSIKNTTRGRWWLPPGLGRAEFYECVFAHGLFVHQKCSNYALTNLLFSLCKSMWIIYPLVTHLSPHPRAPAHPSTPEVLRAKKRAPTLYPSIVFTFGLTIESIKEFGGALGHLPKKENHRYVPCFEIKPNPKNVWQSFENPLAHLKCINLLQPKCSHEEFICLEKSTMDSKACTLTPWP
jgi:hypothetical protein